MMLFGRVPVWLARGLWGRRKARGERGDVVSDCDVVDVDVAFVVVLHDSLRICCSKLSASGSLGSIFAYSFKVYRLKGMVVEKVGVCDMAVLD